MSQIWAWVQILVLRHWVVAKLEAQDLTSNWTTINIFFKKVELGFGFFSQKLGYFLKKSQAMSSALNFKLNYNSNSFLLLESSQVHMKQRRK